MGLLYNRYLSRLDKGNRGEIPPIFFPIHVIMCFLSRPTGNNITTFRDVNNTVDVAPDPLGLVTLE